jgi:hypothetical protein
MDNALISLKRVSVRKGTNNSHSKRGLFRKSKVKDQQVVYLKDMLEQEVLKQPLEIQRHYHQEKVMQLNIDSLRDQIETCIKARCILQKTRGEGF